VSRAGPPQPGRREEAARALPDPWVSKRRLGVALRAAREDARLTQSEAAGRLEWSLSKIVRIEGGATGLRRTDLDALLGLYGGAAGRDAGGLAGLARAGRSAARAWHSRYQDLLSAGTASYLSWESSAATLVEHCSFMIPPLLQTDDYARAMLRALRMPRVDEQVALLAERRRRLAAAAAGAICYTIDEGVLLRHVGGPAAMSRQVAGLHDIAGSVGAEVAIIPHEAGTYPQPPWAFTVAELATGESLVYFGCYDRQEARGAGAAAEYRARFAMIRGMCLAPLPAARLTAGIAAQMARGAQAGAIRPAEAGM